MTVYEVVLNGESPSGDVKTVLHYDLTAFTATDLQGLADAIRALMVNALDGVMAPSCSYTGITVREDSPGEVGQTFDFGAGPLVGSSSDNQYAAQMACIVRKIASNLNRPNKGRVYQGMLTSEGFTSGGLWSTTVRDALDDYWNAMKSISYSGGDTATLQIKASNPTAPNTVAYNAVGTMSAQANPGTQRRRRQGSGS